MDTQTQTYYRRHAAELAPRYRGAGEGVSAWFQDAFDGFSKILDAGCGSGRDVCRLLLQGHDALGVDACVEMLGCAREACRAEGIDPTGRLIEDALPDLQHFDDGEFDGVLCSAVLMHIPDEHLFDAVYGLRRVLRPGGRLLLSIPAEMPPEVDPITRRDSDGRYFADLPADKLKLLLERVGFSLLWEKCSADALGRPDRSWITLLFERVADDVSRPLDQVESILNRDKKDATYKLALFRALAEIAQTQYNLARYEPAGRVKIPLHAIALKWLAYYWPLVASSTFIAQKYGERLGGPTPIAIRKPLEPLIAQFSKTGGLSAFLMAYKSGQLSAEQTVCFKYAMRIIQSTIWTMPVRYAGGGSDFSVLGYDRADRTVTMPVALWRELTLTGSWIQDATVLRWAELTERLSKGAVGISLVVEKLLSVADPERETGDARRLYADIGSVKCVWTEKTIRNRFDVDHVIPFALWRNNDLWNLLPALPEINNAKRDKLPTQRLIQHRRDIVVSYWEALHAAFTERFDREAAALCGVAVLDRRNWQAPLFSRFAEAVEITAVQRSVPRWEPEGIAFAQHHARPQASPAMPYLPTLQNRQADLMILREPEVAGDVRGASPVMHDFEDIRSKAFVRYLPVVGALAAGEPYSGFDVSGLEAASECPWLEVPKRLCAKNRFVVQIAGDSMEPEFKIGDLAVFEYHRSPRTNNQVVIANLAEFGITSDDNTTDAVKRLTQDATHWIFRSTNSRYKDIRVPKAGCAYPILGILCGRL